MRTLITVPMKNMNIESLTLNLIPKFLIIKMLGKAKMVIVNKNTELVKLIISMLRSKA